MSDTIVVMNLGYIQQIGTPEDIYTERFIQKKNFWFIYNGAGDGNTLLLPPT